MNSPRSHFLIACILMIGAFVGYRMWYQTVVAESVTVAGLDMQISAKSSVATQALSARATLQGRASDEMIAESYFVPESEVVSFINALQTLGKEQGTTVSIASVSTAGSGIHAVLMFTIAIQGEFSGVMRTIGAIEYAPYDLSISSLVLTHTTKNNWRADMKITVGSVMSAPSTTNSSL